MQINSSKRSHITPLISFGCLFVHVQYRCQFQCQCQFQCRCQYSNVGVYKWPVMGRLTSFVSFFCLFNSYLISAIFLYWGQGASKQTFRYKLDSDTMRRWTFSSGVHKCKHSCMKWNRILNSSVNGEKTEMHTRLRGAKTCGKSS